MDKTDRTQSEAREKIRVPVEESTKAENSDEWSLYLVVSLILREGWFPQNWVNVHLVVLALRSVRRSVPLR